MKNIKYLTQFIFLFLLFGIFKILGLKLSLLISKFIFTLMGPFFRSNIISQINLSHAFKDINKSHRDKIIKKMWGNYGKIFAEYMFIKQFRKKPEFSKKIFIENDQIINEIKESSEPVIFISGHFNNFELMAMQIEKSGINLTAIYRPLNNIFLNPIMERIRKKYICRNQIKKGISGMKDLLKSFKDKSSIALMIDQRVSEGIRSNFFGKEALTTTIPAQFVKKFNTKIVPVYIERLENDRFKIKYHNPLIFNSNSSIESITLKLNQELEKMILNNPEQWIWTHNRWK